MILAGCVKDSSLNSGSDRTCSELELSYSSVQLFSMNQSARVGHVGHLSHPI